MRNMNEGSATLHLRNIFENLKNIEPDLIQKTAYCHIHNLHLYHTSSSSIAHSKDNIESSNLGLVFYNKNTATAASHIQTSSHQFAANKNLVSSSSNSGNNTGALGLFDVSSDENCVDVNEIMYLFGDWTLRLDIQLIFSSIYAIIFVVGLIGNGLLIGTIRKRMTVANVFLINLATSDLLLCITALPITPVLAFVKRWIFGNMMCKLVPLCQGISVLISSYCLCLIAVDRYRSIVTPMKVPWTIAEAQAFMALCWIGSVAISSPLFFSQRLQQIVYDNMTLCGEFCGEYNWQETRVKLAYGSALLVVQYLIPVSIMTFCYWKILQKVRQDWIVNTGSMLTEAQQAQTSVRKRRVMYVLILMVSVFMGSWMPLTIVNILRDFGVGFLDIQMYFKLLNVHAIAMTSIVSNPLLYFWMSKRHRRALKDDMFWFTNVRRQQTQQIGLLEKFAPSPSIGILYRKSLERHLLNTAKCNPYRRGTLADPTCMNREKALEEMHANCFLLVPLMPLCVPAGPNSNAMVSNGNNTRSRCLGTSKHSPSNTINTFKDVTTKTSRSIVKKL